MKLSTRQLAAAALMLALAIASQFFKNLSVYITGPIINLILIITTLYCGILCGILLSIITPVTSFLITGSPLMAMVPGIIPCVMAGNILLVVCTGLIYKNSEAYSRKLKGSYFSIEILRLAPGVVAGAALKAIFMGISIVMIVIPVFGKDVPAKLVTVAKTQFSITQLITALIGGVLACLIWPTLKKALKSMRE